MADRRANTIPVIAGRRTRGLFTVSRSFASNMTLWAMIFMLLTLIWGGTVAFSTPPLHHEADIAPTVARKPADQVEDMRRRQMEDDVHDAQQDAELEKIGQKLDRIEPVVNDIQMYALWTARAASFAGSILGAVLIAVMTLLVQRWLRIKPESAE